MFIVIGLFFGLLNIIIKEDIEWVEVVFGFNVIMYGFNVYNGLFNIVIKDFCIFEGIMIILNGGVSGDGDLFYFVCLCYVNKVNDKIVYKIMGEYFVVMEFEWADFIFIDWFDVKGNLCGIFEYEGFDGIVEGYEELEFDWGIDFMRLEGVLYYILINDFEFIFNIGYSNSNYLLLINVGWNQIIDWQVYFV